jgi:hypothetical protein
VYVFKAKPVDDAQIEQMRQMAGVYDVCGAKSTFDHEVAGGVIFHIPTKSRAATFKIFFDELIYEAG